MINEERPLPLALLAALPTGGRAQCAAPSHHFLGQGVATRLLPSCEGLEERAETRGSALVARQARENTLASVSATSSKETHHVPHP
jgi:hypothetical protein